VQVNKVAFIFHISVLSNIVGVDNIAVPDPRDDSRVDP